jgi:hypothetical protein
MGVIPFNSLGIDKLREPRGGYFYRAVRRPPRYCLHHLVKSALRRRHLNIMRSPPVHFALSDSCMSLRAGHSQ